MPRSSLRSPTRRPRAAASSCSPSSASICASATCEPLDATFVPFSAHTRMSGVDIGGRQMRKGAADAIAAHVEPHWAAPPASVDGSVETVARRGSTPLVVADDARVLGVVELKDIVKGGIRERFAELRQWASRPS